MVHMNISNLCFCRTIYKTATTFLGQENSKSNVLLSHGLLNMYIFWAMIFYNLKNSSQDLPNEESNFTLSSLEVGH